jgi:hypothetical protein
MTDVDEIRTLLSLLSAEHGASHSECIRAVSWLPTAEASEPAHAPTPPGSGTAERPTAPSSDQAGEAPPQYVTIAEDPTQWLARHGSPITNWFVMPGAAFDSFVAGLEPHIQVTTAEAYAVSPGTFVIRGLWRVRPGVDVSIFFPPCFDPNDRFSFVALQLTSRGSTMLLQISGASLTTSLNRLIRHLISVGEP